MFSPSSTPPPSRPVSSLVSHVSRLCTASFFIERGLSDPTTRRPGPEKATRSTWRAPAKQCRGIDSAIGMRYSHKLSPTFRMHVQASPASWSCCCAQTEVESTSSCTSQDRTGLDAEYRALGCCKHFAARTALMHDAVDTTHYGYQ